jgi:flagellar basal-body rod protein FlgG
MRALSIAATGMAAQQANVEVIANNIANVNTTGFKRSRAEFADLLYQTERSAGAPGRAVDGGVPESLSFGLGVRSVAVRNLHLQGSFTRTGNKFDLALNGRGYFQLTGANGETLYSRAGAFNRNAQGQLVNADGLALTPSIVVPPATTDVVVNENGQVFARSGTDGQLQALGQLLLASFPNEAGLEPLGGNLFRETTASGGATVAAAGDPGIATIQQGHLEASNVDPVKEITELIAAQRAYEMNSKVVQAADDMYGTVAKGMR